MMTDRRDRHLQERRSTRELAAEPTRAHRYDDPSARQLALQAQNQVDERPEGVLSGRSAAGHLHLRHADAASAGRCCNSRATRVKDMAARRGPAVRSPATRRAREPRSPVPPAEVTLFEGAELEPESELEARAFYSSNLVDQDASSVTFAQCRLRGADLSASRLDQVTLTDCLVTDSSLANVRADGGSMTRVRLAQCRMTGVTWADGVLRDVTVTECRADLSAWRMTTFDAVAFVGCNLHSADFTNADLRGVVFRDCDLTSAVFHHASMEGTRFRGCNLAGVGDLTSWKGAVVHHTDLISLSYGLAQAAGIRVEDEDS